MINIQNLLVVFVVVPFLFLFFRRSLSNSEIWTATVTPLASIIGSGFLVSAPLVILVSGIWAPAVMLCIVTVAYGLGCVMRHNIAVVEPILKSGNQKSIVIYLEGISKPILGIAYIVSVAFYLQLLSAFVLKMLGFDEVLYENLLSVFILSLVGIIGKIRGLSFLEFLEKYSVNIKLSIILSLLVLFLIYDVRIYAEGNLQTNILNNSFSFDTVRTLLGFLIIVQGFETSRFLSSEHAADMRIKTMKYAQIISGFIYVSFVTLTLGIFDQVDEITEVSIMDFTKVVAPILPFLLLIAAVMSQFSAALADTLGSSGLIAECSKYRVSEKTAILAVALLAIILTIFTNIVEIISLASKAFAIYYGLQCIICACLAINNKKYTVALFSIILSLVMLIVVLLGMPVSIE